MTNNEENVLLKNVSSCFEELKTSLFQAEDELRPWLNDPVSENDPLTIGLLFKKLKKTLNNVTERSLFTSLEDWVKEYKERHSSMGMMVTYNELGEKMPLPRMVENELTCVLQEACGNAVKHGKAGVIQILVIYQEDSLKVTIADNGIGLDLEKMKTEGGNGAGLTNMRSRMKKIGGSVEFFNKEEGSGSVVSLDISFRDGESEHEASWNVVIGRELHDVICPELIGVAMILATLKRQLTEAEAEKWYEIRQIEEGLQRYTSKMRKLSHQLLK